MFLSISNRFPVTTVFKNKIWTHFQCFRNRSFTKTCFMHVILGTVVWILMILWTGPDFFLTSLTRSMKWNCNRMYSRVLCSSIMAKRPFIRVRWDSLTFWQLLFGKPLLRLFLNLQGYLKQYGKISRSSRSLSRSQNKSEASVKEKLIRSKLKNI